MDSSKPIIPTVETVSGTAADAKPTVRRHAREWGVVVGIALFAALFIRAFCFQPFRIPTPSMEKSLLVGDLVLVSKLHYGPRTPITLGLPLTDRYLSSLELPWTRLPGFSDVQRGDVVVFNYPLESAPIDRKTHFIKRVVALPGDTLAVERKQVVVNRVVQPRTEAMQLRWQVRSKEGARLPTERFEEVGIEEVVHPGGSSRLALFAATEAVAQAVAAWPEVAMVDAYVTAHDPRASQRLFPHGKGYTLDDYGPIYVPGRGDTLRLTPETWPIYQPLITRYEGRVAVHNGDGWFQIDGVTTSTYVVEDDYFFVMGDNRDNSSDSRVWGLVPRSHVVGKAVLIYFSADEREGAIRYDRILNTID